MGNKPLSDKIPILGESSLKMNEKILDLFNINNNIWNQDEIEKRNSILAEIAYSEIWS
jgi:hypothetical protein